jgi:hypothetical protein
MSNRKSITSIKDVIMDNMWMWHVYQTLPSSANSSLKCDQDSGPSLSLSPHCLSGYSGGTQKVLPPPLRSSSLTAAG